MNLATLKKGTQVQNEISQLKEKLFLTEKNRDLVADLQDGNFMHISITHEDKEDMLILLTKRAISIQNEIDRFEKEFEAL